MKTKLPETTTTLTLTPREYPYPLLQKTSELLLTISQFVEISSLTKGCPTVYMLIFSVLAGGQLSQCKYMDLLCLRFNSLSLLKNKPSGSC